MGQVVQPILSILMWLIPLAAVPRVIYCIIYIAVDSEQAPTYKRRLRNAILFVCVTAVMGALIQLVSRYIGMTSVH